MPLYFNELITIFVAAGISLFALYGLKKGFAWLFAFITVNLICISVFGGVIISLFGGTTNAGNMFYVGVFFAGQLLTEHFGKRKGRDSIIVSVVTMLFFLFAARFTLVLFPDADSAGLMALLQEVFDVAPRVAAASVLSYLISQSINIEVYTFLKKRGPIWFRSLMATGAGQFVDSLLFFSIAFSGTLSTAAIINVASTGFVIKTLAGACTIPLIYLSYHLLGKPVPAFTPQIPDKPMMRG